jgi:ferredoxin-NADP reductase/YHS domain-containing protein
MHDHDEHEHHHHHDDNAAVIPPERQAVCVVTGDTVDKQEAETLGHVREYNGQKYYFCCNTCVQLFDKNPEQYAEPKEDHIHLGHEHHHHIPTSGTLRLKEKEHLTDNVWAFRFEPDESLSWIAGQFIRVELPHDNPDDEGTKRWFTVSSAPYEDIVQITTRVTDSSFKQALANLPVGGELHLIEKPDGDFVWEDSDKPLVFVAGGIGVTPIRSILKQRMHESLPLNVTLIYGNRTDAIVFKDEFDGYAAQDDEFNVQYVTGEPLTAANLTELVPNLNFSPVYISGPEPMVEALSNELKAAGLPEAQLKQDFFPNYNEANY